MFNQLTELEQIIIKLEQMTSIFNIMCQSYFEDAEPNEYHLIIGYKDYTNVIDALRDMVISQKGDLHDITGKLYTISRELKKLAKQNMALLEGGGANA